VGRHQPEPNSRARSKAWPRLARQGALPGKRPKLTALQQKQLYDDGLGGSSDLFCAPIAELIPCESPAAANSTSECAITNGLKCVDCSYLISLDMNSSLSWVAATRRLSNPRSAARSKVILVTAEYVEHFTQKRLVVVVVGP
jgi:hypothetical protein